MRQMIAVGTRGRSRMRESCTYGSVRGALSNERPYRNGEPMQRRHFHPLLGGAAAAWPLAARAQQPPTMPVIGYLHVSVPQTNADLTAAFRKGLAEVGYVEGRNVAIEYLFADNDPARLPALAADLVRRRVAVIATPGGPVSTLAAKVVTS